MPVDYLVSPSHVMTKRHVARNIVTAIQQFNAEGRPSASSLDVAARLGESRTTVGRYMTRLVQTGRLKRHGVGSSTRYSLADVTEWIGRELSAVERGQHGDAVLVAHQAYEAAKAYAERMQSLVRRRSPARGAGKPAAGIVVVTPDGGMHGRYASAVLGTLVRTVDGLRQSGTEVVVTAIGQIGVSFVRSCGYSLVSSIEHIGVASRVDGLIGPLQIQADWYQTGETGSIYLIHASFIESANRGVVVEQILPLPDAENPLPDPASSLDAAIVQRFIEATVLRSVAETIVLEAVLSSDDPDSATT